MKLAHWLANLIGGARALSPARKAFGLAAGAAAVAFVAWLILGASRGTAPGPAGPTAPGLPPVSSAGDGFEGREQEARLERELAAQAESLLARTTGEGRVAVRVRAELDASRREETRERFDPGGQVERAEERTSGPAARGGAGAAGTTTERVEYDVGKEVTRVVTPAGAIRRLHVAVLVDSAPVPGLVPWSAAELAQLEVLAKQAVGFSGERGDELSVTTAPFRASGGLAPGWALPGLGGGVAAYAALLAGLGVLILLALRSSARASSRIGLPMSVAELEAALLGSELDVQEPALVAPGAPAGEGASTALPAGMSDAGAAALRSWLKED